MIVLPAAIAVTKPVEAFTVATDVLEELHVPPVEPVELYVAVEPIQSGVVPVTVPAETLALTVSKAEADTGDPQPLFTV